MDEIIDGFQDSLGPYLPRVIGALAILIVGWLIAAVVARIVKRLLHRVDIDNRIARILSEDGSGQGAEQVGASIVYWLIMLVVFVAALEALALTTVTEPLNAALTEVFEYIPRIFGAAIILLIAWVVARLVRAVLQRGLAAIRLDERVNSEAGRDSGGSEISGSVSEAAYWLVFLFFLPAILGALEVHGMLEPVQGMVDSILAFFPNLLAAAFILAIGWFVATLVRRIVTNLLRATGVDEIGVRAGIPEGEPSRQVSSIVGLVVYALILLPVVVAALNALEVEGVAEPTSAVLATMLDAVPGIIAATLVLVVSYFVARLVADVVSSILEGAGFNAVPGRLGFAANTQVAGRSPSAAAGLLVMVAILLFASLQAVDLLGWERLAVLVSDFTVFGGQVLLGIVIIGLGLFLANVAASAVASSGVDYARLLATLARVGIIVFSLAVGLREMGIANEIIILAFGLPLGALAVAAAVAIGVSVGVGGREVAAEEVASFRDYLKRQGDQG